MSKSFAAFGSPMQPVEGAAVWDRDSISRDTNWKFALSDATLSEIKANLARLDSASFVLKDVTAENFPLPSFAAMGRAIREQIASGRGIAMLSGLDVANYSLSEAKLVYTGLVAHIGVTVSQSHLGDYIGEVMDHRDPNDERRYHNGGEFVMHRDPTADVSGLLSIRKSKTGGLSRIMSAATFHNVMFRDYPELMETAYNGFYYRRTTPDRGETELYTPYRIPVFDFTDAGEFSSHYIPYFSEDYQKRDELPEDHIEVRTQRAIKDIIWGRPELCLEYMMEPGDMSFVSNRIALHSRTDYEDYPEIERARLLIRVWMQIPELSELPVHMQMFTNRDRANGGIAWLNG